MQLWLLMVGVFRHFYLHAFTMLFVKKYCSSALNPWQWFAFQIIYICTLFAAFKFLRRCKLWYSAVCVWRYTTTTTANANNNNQWNSKIFNTICQMHGVENKPRSIRRLSKHTRICTLHNAYPHTLHTKAFHLSYIKLLSTFIHWLISFFFFEFVCLWDSL